jgi:hypothetical protein
MTIRPATGAIATIAILATATPAPAVAQSDSSAAQRGFARLTSLAGQWAYRDSVADGSRENVVVTGTVAYELVANGTTLQERVHGPDHDVANMISMIRLDGGRLVLDHYCSSGTQPRLVSRGLDGNVIRFVFEGGTNIPASTTGHIHAATFTFLSKGRFESRWTWQEPGNTHVGARRHRAALTVPDTHE